MDDDDELIVTYRTSKPSGKASTAPTKTCITPEKEKDNDNNSINTYQHTNKNDFGMVTNQNCLERS